MVCLIPAMNICIYRLQVFQCRRSHSRRLPKNCVDVDKNADDQDADDDNDEDDGNGDETQSDILSFAQVKQ